MPLLTSRRIKHLTRYFALLGLLLFAAYQYTGFGYYLLVVLGPSFYLSYWALSNGGVVTSWMRDNPLFINFLLLLPLTVIYFGLIGFQFKSVLNERGKMRIFVLLILLAFLGYIHFVAFQELSLYWHGSEKLA
ncbi:MAG: hypothetical protein HY447_01925 [Candidatus Omnitrophica bacterium]|nr:hypothetical protein [Candidatus Omnitrophota bacterium]